MKRKVYWIHAVMTITDDEDNVVDERHEARRVELPENVTKLEVAYIKLDIPAI